MIQKNYEGSKIIFPVIVDNGNISFSNINNHILLYLITYMSDNFSVSFKNATWYNTHISYKNSSIYQK